MSSCPAGILEWVAFPFSRGSSQLKSPALHTDSLPSEPPGKLVLVLFLYCLPLSDTRVKLNAYEPFHKERRGEMKSSKFKHTCYIAIVSCGVERGLI